MPQSVTVDVAQGAHCDRSLRFAGSQEKSWRPPEAIAMLQIRFHGRGGQGVVTAAELLAIAAFAQGRHAQAFPSFGSERTGAPVVAFCRIADGPIRAREPIAEPDALIVQDPTLLNQVDVFGGVGAAAFVLINTTRPLAELGLE